MKKLSIFLMNSTTIAMKLDDTTHIIKTAGLHNIIAIIFRLLDDYEKNGGDILDMTKEDFDQIYNVAWATEDYNYSTLNEEQREEVKRTSVWKFFEEVNKLHSSGVILDPYYDKLMRLKFIVLPGTYMVETIDDKAYARDKKPTKQSGYKDPYKGGFEDNEYKDGQKNSIMKNSYIPRP